MSDASPFSNLPGFDFLQGLVKNAGAALPNVGQWVAPTLNPEELDKRIQELKTVQFWLDQNSRMISATIQALEVQKMTLGTLQSMNVSMESLRESMMLKVPKMPEAAAAAPQAETEAEPATPGAVDPMKWWGALTQQFTQLAANAMADNSATEAARNLAGDMVKQSLDAAGETLKQAVAMPTAMAQQAASAKATPAQAPAVKKSASKTAGKTASPAAAPKPAAKKAR